MNPLPIEPHQPHPLFSMNSPKPITVEPVRVSAELLSGDRSRIDAFASAMLQREREYQEAMADLPENTPTPEDINRMAAMEDEKFSEGRRRHPRIPSPHFD